MTDLSTLFTRLIEDRVGNHASRIVEALAGEPYKFPHSFGVATGNRWYRLTFAVQPRPARIVLTSLIDDLQTGSRLDTDGPTVEALGLPSSWSKLEAFRLAEALDAAFRGHGSKFDNTIA